MGERGKDMATITYTEYTKYLNELHEHIEQKVGAEWARRIQVYEMHRSNLREGIELGVNWSAIGTVSTDEAREFGNALDVIVREVETFPFNGYKVVFD